MLIIRRWCGLILLICILQAHAISSARADSSHDIAPEDIAPSRYRLPAKAKLSPAYREELDKSAASVAAYSTIVQGGTTVERLSTPPPEHGATGSTTTIYITYTSTTAALVLPSSIPQCGIQIKDRSDRARVKTQAFGEACGDITLEKSGKEPVRPSWTVNGGEAEATATYTLPAVVTSRAGIESSATRYGGVQSSSKDFKDSSGASPANTYDPKSRSHSGSSTEPADSVVSLADPVSLGVATITATSSSLNALSILSAAQHPRTSRQTQLQQSSTPASSDTLPASPSSYEPPPRSRSTPVGAGGSNTTANVQSTIPSPEATTLVSSTAASSSGYSPTYYTEQPHSTSTSGAGTRATVHGRCGTVVLSLLAILMYIL